MNLSEKWVSGASEGKSRLSKADLGRMLNLGFEVVEIGGEPVLVWGGDAVGLVERIDRMIDEAVKEVRGVSKGQLAYEERVGTTKTWVEIGEGLGISKSAALMDAKFWAGQEGLEWPVG